MSPTATRHAGTFGILLFLIVAALLAVVVLFGDALRQAAGILPAPSPSTLPPAAGPLPAPSAKPLPPQASLPPTDLSRYGFADQPAANILAPPQPTPEPARPVDTSRPDDDRAKDLLDQLDTQYRTFQWDNVSRTGETILGLNIDRSLRATTRARLRSAQQVADFMRAIDSDKYGMSRNLETDPRLIELVTGMGTTLRGVVINSFDDKTILDLPDPAAYVQQQLTAGRSVAIMDLKRIPANYDSGKVQSVSAVDTKTAQQEAEENFQTRFARLKSSDLWSDPLALFDAARFAYANRIDDQVTNLLDRALLLNPQLAQQVKEDEAQPLFEKLVLVRNQGNKTTAAGFLATLKKNFSDTSVYAQARAFYDGDGRAALAAAETARKQIEEARKAEFAQRKQLAQEAGDQQAVEQITQEEDLLAQRAATNAENLSQVSGDEAEGDRLFAEGEQIYADAIAKGNSKERDQLYAKAEGYFNKAVAIYGKLVAKNPNDPKLSSKLVRANQLRYGSIKQRRF